ncbi:hypothetical protein NLJ89_g3507 [Agrocybe chaxingu]|uniref:DUF6533 domain-containing protein n=1 Tax=Agrocybe chaxingu TaxID=84603 RepID=A0A9W8K4Q3_9AGAR|nr:hypothetical protein NLJ89_g3507 [Agrocybe chaxingu]
MSTASAKSVRILRFSIQYASVTLLYYDYALTWTREVQYVWLKKFTISTALYIACRNKWILALFGSLGLAIIALAALGVPYVSCTTAKGSPPYVLLSAPAFLLRWCSLNFQRYIPFKGDPPWRNVLVVLTVVYESLSAILTTWKSLMGMKVNGTWRLNQQGLTYRVLEQGLLYFVFVSAFSIASLILQFRAPAGSFLQRLLNALTLPYAFLSSTSTSTPSCSPDYSPATAAGQPTNTSAHELLKTIVQDVMFDFQRETKAEMMGLHLDLLRMGRGWKNELRVLMDEYVGDLRELREENQRLRVDNERLRRGVY